MQREKVVPFAKGIALEIGIGSGWNLQHYNAAKVSKIIGVDPDGYLWKRSAGRQEASSIGVKRIELSGEDTPLDNNSADIVVCTYTLCTIPDLVKALLEMRRTLKPGGKILFSEHGKAPDENVARWQRRIDPVWKRPDGGCHLDRDMPDLFLQPHLKFDTLGEMYLPEPKPMGYNYWGSEQ